MALFETQVYPMRRLAGFGIVTYTHPMDGSPWALDGSPWGLEGELLMLRLSLLFPVFRLRRF